MAAEKLQEALVKEYKRHRYLLDSDNISEEDKERYHSILKMNVGLSAYATALQFLSECLEQYHGQKVIILLDEYDVPLENAYFNGFYDYREDYYHGFLAGLLKNSRGYVIKSNRESGLGRYDLVLKTRQILMCTAALVITAH